MSYHMQEAASLFKKRNLNLTPTVTMGIKTKNNI